VSRKDARHRKAASVTEPQENLRNTFCEPFQHNDLRNRAVVKTLAASTFERILHLASCCVPRGSPGKIIQLPLLAPFYHIVSDEQVPHVKHLYGYRTVDEFEKDMEFFLKYHRPIALDEILVRAKGGKTLAENCFFLSFDDGHRESYDIVAPILKKKGIPATFFVASATLDNADMLYRHKASLLVNHLLGLQHKNNPGVGSILAKHGIHTCDSASGVLSVRYKNRKALDEIAGLLDLDFKEYLKQRRPYLTTSEIKSLISDGFTVGAHSIDHPFYPELNIEEQLRQTGESVNAVKQSFGLDYKAFAFPFGDKGVSKRFFSGVLARNLADVIFGSSAFLNDEHVPFGIQRLEMEDQRYSAEDILRMAEIKFMIRLMTGAASTRRVE
jgi:peptidoglycan/xylan/chitin deacetylase (PgdA/CDA1 family)